MSGFEPNLKNSIYIKIRYNSLLNSYVPNFCNETEINYIYFPVLDFIEFNNMITIAQNKPGPLATPSFATNLLTTYSKY